ncbi:hypothetical protein GGI12_002761 [Dipsacomyces acuminosporus]|nr:hypothetical protein GGI12_002761 [Dipsacomyces acuminosporus]
MATSILRAERTLSLLTSSYLANAEAVKANIGLVIDTVLSQNLFEFSGAATVAPAEVMKRYDSATHKWVVRIGSLVAGKTPESRIAGVLLMKHTAQQSPQIFIDNAPKWITSLLNILGKAEMTPVHSAAIETLLGFLDIVREIPVLQREIANTQVPRVNLTVLALAEKNPELLEQALNVLTYSASWFPTLFRPSIDKTEALCLRVLDGCVARSSPAVVKQAANCLASLCQAGGKVAVEDRWFQYVQMTIGTIESCIDHIMCIGADAINNSDRQTFALQAFSDNFMISIPKAVERTASMADMLIALLGRPTNVDVSVPVDAIAAIASKLAFIPLRVASSKTDRAEFGLIPLLAPQIYRAAIRILASLAISLGSYMHPFLSSVARTIAVMNSKHVASPTTRVALHSLIQLYIQKYSYGFVVCLSTELIGSVVADTSVQNRKAAAAAGPLPSAASSKKRGGSGKARDLTGAATDASEDSAKPSDILWNDVVYAALKTVLALLKHTPTALSPSLRTRLDSQILTLLLLHSVNGSGMPFASRRGDAAYRVVLFECLQASILSPDPWQAAILPHAASVFTAGAADPSPTVQRICLDSLSIIEPIIHSRLPAQLRAPETEEQADLSNEAVHRIHSTKRVGSLTAANEIESDADDSDNAEESIAKRFKQNGSVETAPETAPETPALPTWQADSASAKIDTHELKDNQQPKLKPSRVFAETSVPATANTRAAPPSDQAIKHKDSATTKPKTAPSFLSSGPRTNASSLSAALSESKEQADAETSDNDDIPDIIMDGSDSEDED